MESLSAKQSHRDPNFTKAMDGSRLRQLTQLENKNNKSTKKIKNRKSELANAV